MADTSPTQESTENSSEKLSYLNILAKSFLTIPGIARDTNVARQNMIKLVKLKGGDGTNKADAHFLKEGELETKLQVQKEKSSKLSPVKDDSSPAGGGGFFKKALEKMKGTKTGKKVTAMKDSFIKGFRRIFSPKNFLKVLGKLALPALIVTTLYEGFTSAFDAYTETGSIWEAFKAGVGGIVDFLTFGIIDKQMVDDMMQNVADFMQPVTDAVGEFFSKFSTFFSDKFNSIKEFLGLPVEKKTKEVAVVGDKDFEAMTDEEQQQAVNALNEKIRAEEARIKKKIDALAAAEAEQKGGFAEKARETLGIKKKTAAEMEAETGVTRSETAPGAVPKKAEQTGGDTKPAKVGSEAGKKAMIKAMNDAKIENPSARAAIMAQVGHESGNFTTLSENLNYKAPTLLKLFPKKFTSPEDAQQVAAGGPRSVAERIYGGRMGNKEPGEGYEFRGRGFIQLTGKQNYTKFGVVSDPDSVSKMDTASDTAIKYMMQYKGDWNDIKAVTKFVNGGYIGLDDRMKHFQAYLNDPEITKIGASPSAASGGTVASASTENAAAQRQQQKPQTPVVVNAPTTNNQVVNTTQNAAAKPNSSTASNMANRVS
jgi:putative chitinase